MSLPLTVVSGRLSLSQPSSPVAGPGTELGQWASGEYDRMAGPVGVCEAGEAADCGHTPGSVGWKHRLGSGHGDLCSPAALTCAHRLSMLGCGEGRVHFGSAPRPAPPPHIKYPQDRVRVAGSGCKWGLGAHWRTGEAPRASSWVSKPWTAGRSAPWRGSLCVDALITSPTSPPPGRPPLGEALLGTPSRTERLQVGPQSRRSRSFSQQRPAGRFWTPSPGAVAGLGRGAAQGPLEGAGAGRPGAGGRGVKCGISCRAVAPDSLPSARGSV